MTELFKFNLPKVKLRIKTSPIESTIDEKQPHQFKQYQASPLVFQQRQKMKKQILESHLRFRMMKKNNYRKRFASNRKPQLDGLMSELKRNSTINIDHSSKGTIDHTSLTLEVDQNQSRCLKGWKRSRDRQRLSTQMTYQRFNSFVRQDNNKGQKNSENSIDLFKSRALNEECQRQVKIIPFHLSGRKCAYNKYIQSKNLLTALKPKIKKKIVLQDHGINFNEDKIDAWRDSISQAMYNFQQQL